jgi:hypothetical protein
MTGKVTAAFLLLLSVGFAEPPVAKIDGPDKARTGDIIVLSSGDAEHVDWLVDSSGVQVPEEDAASALRDTADKLRKAGFDVTEPETDAPPVYLELDGGKRLLLASYTGVYRVHLAVGNSDGVDQCAHVVTVGTPKPPKPDDPDPPPEVEPSLPVGRFGLAIKSWRAAQKVQSEKRADEAKILAAVLLVSMAAPDGQAMVDAFASTMKAKFNATQKTAWEPWRASYLAELKALQDGGKLPDRTSWIAAFSEMALGLSAVEK